MESGPDRSVVVHEDDVGMCCLHPVAARAEVRRELAAARAAAERNRAPDGVGWLDVHVVEPPTVDFTTVGLRRSHLEAALEPLLPRIRGFRSGPSGPFGVREDDACCFGFDEECFVKAEVADGERAGPGGADARVAEIWFEPRTADVAHLDALLAGLRAVDALTPCVLVDHWRRVEGVVGDGAFLAGYAASLGDPPG